MGYKFILYKHGPFCFDLRNDLTALQADGILELKVQRPYGPRIALTPQSDYIQSLYSKTLRRHEKGIAFVAESVGDKGVVDLERLGTALYVGAELGYSTSEDVRAAHVTERKPHISPGDALAAVREADKLAKEALRLKTTG